ncbi:MAG TPA: heme biosynthesis HemY N-terminal domain-containing protein, partial [Spongiibacteraceae bacterium]|nr:heme biosynthesis HemY N-terminal domain-containing protein [Spongiibacteraceae bacterium]
GNYTLETTVWVGVALLLAILIAMYGAILLLHRSVRQGNLFSRWRSNWNERRGRQLTQRGLLAYLEGNFERARVVLDRGANRSEIPSINYLLAARASAAHGEYKLAEQYLLRAQRNDDGTDFAVAVTAAELQLRQGRLQDALASLNRLRKQAEKHPYVLKLLQDTYTGLRDWENLIALLPQLRKAKLITREAADDLEARATASWFDDLAAQKQVEKMRGRWQSLSRAVSRDSGVVTAYARGLIALRAGDEAEPIIRAQLKREWNEPLITLYGKAETSDASRQLAQAEQWQRDKGNSAVLLLCLGRLAVRNQQWGKARDYFEQSLHLADNPETDAELARLLARLGQHERSAECFERALTGTAVQ